MLRSIPKKWFGRCGYNVQNFYMFINNEHDKNMNNRLKNENHRENDRYASYAGISQIPQIELNFFNSVPSAKTEPGMLGTFPSNMTDGSTRLNTVIFTFPIGGGYGMP